MFAPFGRVVGASVAIWPFAEVETNTVEGLLVQPSVAWFAGKSWAGKRLGESRPFVACHVHLSTVDLLGSTDGAETDHETIYLPAAPGPGFCHWPARAHRRCSAPTATGRQLWLPHSAKRVHSWFADPLICAGRPSSWGRRPIAPGIRFFAGLAQRLHPRTLGWSRDSLAPLQLPSAGDWL
jgi:hypothetical protein